jgi:hypothetical protein
VANNYKNWIKKVNNYIDVCATNWP